MIVQESFWEALGNLNSKCGTCGFTWKKLSLLQREIQSLILWHKATQSPVPLKLGWITFSVQYALYRCQYLLSLSICSQLTDYIHALLPMQQKETKSLNLLEMWEVQAY